MASGQNSKTQERHLLLAESLVRCSCFSLSIDDVDARLGLWAGLSSLLSPKLQSSILLHFISTAHIIVFYFNGFLNLKHYAETNIVFLLEMSPPLCTAEHIGAVGNLGSRTMQLKSWSRLRYREPQSVLNTGGGF